MRAIRYTHPGAMLASMARPNVPEKPRNFAPRGPLALDPRAFGLEMFFGDAPVRDVQIRGGVAIVEIQGPLMHHEDPWVDSYDEIKRRVSGALGATDAHCVLLSIDSPGGLVAGCFDTVAELRAMAEQAGKPLYAYVDAQACSGGYALACAAEKIWIPASGIVGSIGVIEGLLDATGADAEWGVAWTLVASGARKTDGNPHTPTTPEAVAAVKHTVDALAAQFFGLVAANRGVDPGAVASLEAGLLCGQEAIAAGLADEIGTLDSVVALLAQDAASTDAGDEEQYPMTIKEIRAGLKAVAEDENAPDEERSAARKALSAMDDEEEPSAQEPDGDEHQEPDGDEPSSEDDEEEPQAAAGRRAPSARTTRAPAQASADMALAARVQALEAERAEERERGERATLMASRQDFTKETVAWLSGQSIDVVRNACRPPAKAGETYDPSKHGLPRGPGNGPGGQVAAARAAMTGTASPTVGESSADAARSGGARTNLSGHADDLDVRMGLAQPKNLTGHDPQTNVTRLSVMTPKQAREFVAQRKAQQAK